MVRKEIWLGTHELEQGVRRGRGRGFGGRGHEDDADDGIADGAYTGDDDGDEDGGIGDDHSGGDG